MNDSYDYFNPDDEDDNKTEREPDITWNLEDDKTNEDNTQLTSTDSSIEKGFTEDSEGFWAKIKNIIKS